MNYATVNDLCARYTRTRLDILTRPKTADGQPDDAVAEQALADASAFIDGYL
ncbi:phage protein Gp36 family protein, partial [Pseudomonas aeruginosa]